MEKCMLYCNLGLEFSFWEINLSWLCGIEWRPLYKWIVWSYDILENTEEYFGEGAGNNEIFSGELLFLNHYKWSPFFLYSAVSYGWLKTFRWICRQTWKECTIVGEKIIPLIEGTLQEKEPGRMFSVHFLMYLKQHRKPWLIQTCFEIERKKKHL